jgi:hypothetical protein
MSPPGAGARSQDDCTELRTGATDPKLLYVVRCAPDDVSWALVRWLASIRRGPGANARGTATVLFTDR